VPWFNSTLKLEAGSVQTNLLLKKEALRCKINLAARKVLEAIKKYQK
jgi:hypothetical protein